MVTLLGTALSNTAADDNAAVVIIQKAAACHEDVKGKNQHLASPEINVGSVNFATIHTMDASYSVFHTICLLNARTKKLQSFFFPPPVPYAILAHTFSSPGHNEWSAYSATVRDTIIENSCRLAVENKLDFIWIDAVCVDKTNSSAVSEAINSVWKYLKLAKLCFAYLVDLRCQTPGSVEDGWRQSLFWKRAWTLQELILPERVQFFDSRWHFRGERSTPSVSSFLSRITGVDADVLSQKSCIKSTSVARRMSWAVGRHGSYAEDLSYALLGLFDVSMPIIYGEGSDSAFRRLQEEIMKGTIDMTIFAWTSKQGDSCRGVFARSVTEFESFGHTGLAARPFKLEGFAALTNRGVLIQGPFSKRPGYLILDLGTQHNDSDDKGRRVGIALERMADGTYSRTNCSEIVFLLEQETTTLMQVMTKRGEVDRMVERPRPACLPIRKGMEYPGGLPTAPNSPRPDDDQEEKAAFLATKPDDDLEWVQISHGPYQRTESEKSNCNDSARPMATGNGVWENAVAANSERRPGADPDNDHLATLQQLVPMIRNRFRHTREGRIHSIRQRKFAMASNHRTRTHRIHKKRAAALTESVELGCPFYKNDPFRHIDCLKYNELKTMSDVRRHLWRSHRVPFHCPICQRCFDSAAERDGHIIRDTCVTQSSYPYYGVSDDQQREISSARKISHPVKQWFRVWEILFHNSRRPNSAWLNTALELEISSFRSFYKDTGRELVEKVVQHRRFEEDWGVEYFQSTVFAGVVTSLVNDFLARPSVHVTDI